MNTIEPLKSFLEKEISPAELSILLDNFFDDYLDRMNRLNKLKDHVKLHADTDRFFYIIRRLREVLMACE